MINSLVKKYQLSNEELDAMVEDTIGHLNDAEFDALVMQRVPDYVNPKSLRKGDVVTGTVVDLRGNIVLIEFGHKSEGVLPYKENTHINDDLDIGDIIQVLIDDIKGGQVLLTRKGVDRLVREDTTVRSISPGDRVWGKLVSQAKGGWIIEINSCLSAFLPQLSSGFPNNAELDNLDKDVEVEVESVDVESRQVTLTRKSIAEEERKTHKQGFMTTLEPGLVCEGTVRNLTDFGAFIQIAPGIIGLCHRSDQGEAELEVGTKTMVKVLKVDKDKNRVSLGIRQVSEPTWEEMIQKYAPNDQVTGVVTSFVPYGAFVEIEPGLHGLVHISDISWSEHIRRPADALQIGEQIDAVVLGIEVDRKRISLGVKQVNPDPWELVNDKYLVGSVVTGQVTAVKEFGAFVELEKGVTGLIHVGLGGTDAIEGQSIDVMVTKIDVDSRKINLKFS